MNQRMIILLGVAAVLAAIVVFDQLRPSSTDNVVQPVRRQAVVEIAQESGPFLPDQGTFSAITARPLFRSDRRPPAAPIVTPVETVTPVTVDDTPPDFVIVGVVTGPDSRGAATVRDGTETRRVYIGDTVQGWRIDRINPDGVVVTRGDGRWSLPIGERED